MNFCNKCGSKLINGICPNCSKIKKNKKKSKVIIISLVFIVVIFSGVFFYLKSQLNLKKK